MAKRPTSKRPASKRPASQRQTSKRAPRPKKPDLNEPVVPAPESSSPEPDLLAATVTMEPPAHEENTAPVRSRRVILFSFTFAGILLGVALGYYLGSEAAKTEPSAIAPQTTTVPATIDADRAHKVLVLIEEELVENARILRQQRELRERRGVDLSISSQIVKSDLWRTVTNSSDAQALRDTVLLHSVATAYGYLDEVGLLQRKAVEVMSFGGKPAAPREAGRALLSTLAKISALAEKSVVDAAVLIDHRINAKQ